MQDEPRLRFEQLTSRLLLTASSFGDVNGDGSISPLDALLVINAMNRPQSVNPAAFDIDQNGTVTPSDALIVINHLNDAIVDDMFTNLFAHQRSGQQRHGPITGDYNLDCEVDDHDFALITDNFGSTTNLAADGNGNGIIDAADITLWRDNRGTRRCLDESTEIWSLRNRAYDDRDLRVEADGNVNTALAELGGDAAQWRVTFAPSSTDQVRLQNMENGEYLSGFEAQAFTTPTIDDFTQWEIVRHDDGSISLRNMFTSFHLDADAEFEAWDVELSADTENDARWTAAVWTLPSTPTVTFAMIGDYGTNSLHSRNVASRIQQANPDFILTAGDSRYGNQTYDDGNGRFCNYLSNVTAGVHCPSGGYSTPNRFFSTAGNHDYDDSGGIDEYLDYFDFPGNGAVSTTPTGNDLFYDVVLGPVHVFALDSEAMVNLHEDGYRTQVEWLETAIAGSTSAWQVVVLHHTPYSSSNHGENRATQLNYANLGVDLILAGHDHVYERIQRDGTTYVVNGLGGHVLYPLHDRIEGSEVAYRDEFGALFMDASETTLRGRFLDVQGNVIDSFLVQPAVGGEPEIEHNLNLSGTVFNDVNENGYQDDDEVGIANTLVYVDSNRNIVRDPDEPFTMTDENGNYDFAFEGPRHHLLIVEAPEGYEVTNIFLRNVEMFGLGPFEANFGLATAGLGLANGDVDDDSDVDSKTPWLALDNDFNFDKAVEAASESTGCASPANCGGGSCSACALWGSQEE